MSAVSVLTVAADEEGLRLDRWFRRRFPNLTHGRLEKLLRTGQIRVDGGRVKASARLVAGQSVRVPPLPDAAPPAGAGPAAKGAARISVADAKDLQARVLYRDADVLAIDKPPGLAVQGGTGTARHLDGLLDALTFDAGERPRLVHRLDKDTSGVLLLARNVRAAAVLGEALRDRAARKVYWAVVVGVPKPARGRIDLPIAKLPGRAGERMVPDAEHGQKAVTDYRVVERAGSVAAWLAMEPETGRTHQLRVHALALGTPILGDGKYGGQGAFLPGTPGASRLHLHARGIRIPHPVRGLVEVVAPLPPHMAETFAFLGFDQAQGEPLFP